VPLFATATNKLSAGDQVTLCHELTLTLRAVQVIPLGEVITRFVPAADTATNKLSAGDQVTLDHVLASAAERAVQVKPSGLVMTRLVPVLATATNKFSVGDQVTPDHVLASEAVCVCQVNVGAALTRPGNTNNDTNNDTMSAITVTQLRYFGSGLLLVVD
ncbi:hypothetical protein HY469_01005, partial [Candidatus Roizmanbacteria bacterium]|nr:hypothetical protein [Candidatus Roizmanbacteria bacterium]